MSHPKTIGDLLSPVTFKLTKEFHIQPGKPQTTKKTPGKEKISVPPADVVSLDPDWLDKKLAVFLKAHGNVPASQVSNYQFNKVLYEGNTDAFHPWKTWNNEKDFTVAYRPLVQLAACCVNDICADNPDRLIINFSEEDGRWAIPDISCYSYLDSAAKLKCYHFLVEMKTVNVLTQEVIDFINKHAGPNGEWRLPGMFSGQLDGISSHKATTPVNKLAPSVIQQVYGQLVAKTSVEDVKEDSPSSVSPPNSGTESMSASTPRPLSMSPPISPPNTTAFPNACDSTIDFEPPLVAVSPLYAALSNYNQTYFMMRSTGQAPVKLVLAGPYPPSEVIPRLAALIYEQVIENGQRRPRLLDFTSKEDIIMLGLNACKAWSRADEYEEDIDGAENSDDEDDEDGTYETEDSDSTPDETVPKERKRKGGSDNKEDRNGGGGSSGNDGGGGRSVTKGEKGGEKNKRGRGGHVKDGRAAKRANDAWGLNVHFSSITYEYNVRAFNGVKLKFSKRATTLTMWKHPRFHSSVLSGPSSSSPRQHDFPTVPHIIIVARLEEGVSGETYLAVSKHAPFLVWKEIRLDGDHIHYAETEVSMYEGLLATLQGTVVPFFYGAFHNEKENSVVLLMQYVGHNLGSDWESLSPELRERAEDLHARLRAAGVEHGDWAPRNVCVCEGEMRAIDFSHAWPVM